MILLSERLYRILLVLYPERFRRDFGDEMARSFRSLCKEELGRYGRIGLLRLWIYTFLELFATAVKERGHALDMTKLSRLGGLMAVAGGGLFVVHGVSMPLYGRLFWSTGSSLQAAFFDILQLAMQAGSLLLVGGLIGLVCRIAGGRRDAQTGFATRHLPTRHLTVAGRLGPVHMAALIGLLLAAVAGLSCAAGLALVLVSGALEIFTGSAADTLILILSTAGFWTLSVSITLLGFVVWRRGLLGKWSVVPVFAGSIPLLWAAYTTVSALAFGPRTLLPAETLETFVYLGLPYIMLGLPWILLGHALRSEGVEGNRAGVQVQS